ncbi:ribose-5-phosphate isomerase rki1 [Rhizina undulata]
MTSSKLLLLRVYRSDLVLEDGSNAYVLVQVKPSSSLTEALNVQLYATEGERAFATQLKQTKLPDLRHKSYSGSSQELEKIFSALLLRQSIDDDKLLVGLEITSSVEDDTLTLAIRKNVCGIKQRIAAIQVPEADVEIPIFEWAGELCASLESTNEKLADLESRVSAQQAEIEQLASQLKHLAVLKREHEELLLVKFKELLNAKKTKIREVNQVLEKAGSVAVNNAPPEPIEPVTKSRQKSKSAPAVAPVSARARNLRKRKPVAPPSDSDSDGGFAVMSSSSSTAKGKRKAASTVAIKEGTKKTNAATAVALETEDEEGSPTHQLSSPHSTEEEDDELPPPRRPAEFFVAPKPAIKIEDESDGVKTSVGRGRGRGERGRRRGRVGSQKDTSPPKEEEKASTGVNEVTASETEDDEL